MTAEGFSVGWPGRGEPVAPGADGPAPTLGAVFPSGAQSPATAEGGTNSGRSGVSGAVLIGDGARISEAAPTLTGLGLDPVRSAQLVYLDPPYNRGGSFDGHHDNMPRHDWLTYIEARLRVATIFSPTPDRSGYTSMTPRRTVCDASSTRCSASSRSSPT